MKVASFTVHATAQQSTRWKQAAEGEGFPSVGAWLAGAADSYLKIRLRAGMPIPLAWRRGHFRVNLEGGEMVTMRGFISPPFAAFRGTAEGPGFRACHRFTLVYIPTRQVLSTLRTYAQVRSLAAELARQWFRSDGAAPVLQNPGPPVLP